MPFNNSLLESTFYQISLLYYMLSSLIIDHSFQKFKLLNYYEFNYLMTIILTLLFTCGPCSTLTCEFEYIEFVLTLSSGR